MPSELHHYPVLSSYDLGVVRSAGPGLGNLLFPIARALIGSARSGGTFVHPTMRQVKIGPYLRREPDKRTYGRVLRGRNAAEWLLWVKLKSLPHVAEDEPVLPVGQAVVCYEGLRNYFHDLTGARELIGGWLDGNALRAGAVVRPHDVAIHVRLGDFAVAALASGDPSIRLPMDWYRAAIAEARGLAATPSPRFLLFTDGDAATVTRELDLPGIEVDRSPHALAAIERMARSRVIVASRSTFSMWGAFLGDTAAVWDRRFELATYFPLRPGRDVLV